MTRCQTTYVAESSSWLEIVNIFRACYCSLAKENIPTTPAKNEQKFVIKETNSVNPHFTPKASVQIMFSKTKLTFVGLIYAKPHD